jgi:hypothetical protein
MKEYNPKNWYWIIGGSATQVYSSAAGDYVPVANATYVAWLADGTLPTKIDTEANLGGVLAPYYPDVQRPAVAAILDGYQQGQADDIFVRKLSKLLFHMINRIQVLEGKQPFTVAQARAYVKGQM